MKRCALILSLLTLFVTSADAARITDMYGHGVTLPSRVTRVLGASPPVTYMICTLAPSLLVGLNLPPDDGLRRFLHPETLKLPVVGGFGGQGRNFNAEVLLSLQPDVVLTWSPRSSTLNPRVEQKLNSAGIPHAYVKLDNMSDYPAAYEFLGTLLGKKARGRQLSACFSRELKKLKAFSGRIPEGKRVSVYFAEEEDGLTTVSSDSVHGEALALAGGRNVYRKQSGNHRVKDRISIEQVIAFNPEVIIAQDESFYNSVYRDPRWSRVRAVRTRRVYLIPDKPFDWMDRPPSFMRLMGARWLAGVLYPKTAPVNIVSDTRKFYKLFFGASLSDAEVRAILKM